MENEGQSVRIHFRCQYMDLRDVAIVSQGLHRAFNEAFAQGMELHQIYGRRQYFLKTDDPHLVSLEIIELSNGSLSARTRVIIRRGARDLAIGTAGSLVASAVLAIGMAAHRQLDVTITNPPPPEIPTPLDVGPHIREMVKQLALSDKPWELTVEDETHGTKVVIRSGYNR